MRNLQITVIAVFLIISVAFCALFAYDRLMLDHEAPMIVCDGQPLYVSVNATDRELCAGLSATDDVDGDITDRIIVRKVSQLVSSNAATVSYVVFDSSSNICTYNRYVFYTDYRMPVFTLTQPLVYNVGSTVMLSDRLTAKDVVDGDISDRIRVDSSNLSNTTEGMYPLHVTVTNSLGDTSTVDLSVLIQNVTSHHPVIHLYEYLIYHPLNEDLDEEELCSYILMARQSKGGEEVSPDELEILSEVDTSRRGSYNVYYSYTNDQNLTYTVILTVVVE